MRTITLAGPALNALGTELMASTLAAVQAADGEPLLLTGEGRAFCAGLNLQEVHAADLDTMRTFHRVLEDLVGALYHYPGPTAAAVNGHAIAGGAILALVCDRRFITDQVKARIGLNEVALGLRFPPRLVRIVEQCIPRRHQVEVLLGGQLHGPSDAVRTGLADVASADPVGDATTWLDLVGQHPLGAYADAKRLLRPDIVLSEHDRAYFDQVVLPGWVSPEIKERIAGFFKK